MQRVVVVGAGPMGRLHARAVARRAARGFSCRLVGVVDRHPARSEKVATEFGARSVAGNEVDADAAIVAVPTAEHAGVAAGLLDAGLDVLVEKPMTGAAAGAAALVERARRDHRILAVGHSEWWNPLVARLFAAAGKARRIRVERTHPPSTRSLDIDVVQDLMLHDLDWLRRSVPAELETLKATGRCVANDRLDEATASLEFTDGARAELVASRVHVDRCRTIEIEGEQGHVRGDLLSGTVSWVDGRPLPADALPDLEPLDRQVDDFLEACLSRDRPQNDGSEGVATLDWVDRVRGAIGAGA